VSLRLACCLLLDGRVAQWAAGSDEPSLMNVLEQYSQLLAERGYRSDASQQAAVERLQRLDDELSEFKRRRSGFLRKLLDRAQVPRGVWMYGGVGRGKSLLMDVFYEAVPVVRKTRVHFHEFMRSVHRELRDLRQVSDPLDEVARRLAARYRLICFDEFHVSDVADAMILERLLSGLFANGVVFVMTSNYRPDDLYPDGLNRDSILPAIALLKTHLDILNVDAGTDYRRLAMQGVDVYLSPLGAETDLRFAQVFERIAGPSTDDPNLTIEHRVIAALRRSGGVVWFDFATLCDGPRSQLDYLEIATRFHTVMLSCVPCMTAAMSSQARRFTWLVDVFYDQRVKLLIAADVPPEQLYVAGAMSGEFHRTVSRLIEMQSPDYQAAPRRGLADTLA
jgi:cell division protein ZapE